MNGISIQMMPITQPFMGCGAPASWPVPNKATRSTRSPTTLACLARTPIRDQMKVGADGQKRLRLIGKED
jgi:hypothetical protein